MNTATIEPLLLTEHEAAKMMAISASQLAKDALPGRNQGRSLGLSVHPLHDRGNPRGNRAGHEVPQRNQAVTTG